jgi:hypothetical protein
MANGEKEVNLTNGSAKIAWRDLWKIISVIVIAAIIISGFILSTNDRLTIIERTKADQKDMIDLQKMFIEIKGDIGYIRKSLEQHIEEGGKNK